VYNFQFTQYSIQLEVLGYLCGCVRGRVQR